MSPPTFRLEEGNMKVTPRNFHTFKEASSTLRPSMSLPPPGRPDPGVRDLIKRCLTLRAEDRINVNDILRHPWMTWMDTIQHQQYPLGLGQAHTRYEWRPWE